MTSTVSPTNTNIIIVIVIVITIIINIATVHLRIRERKCTTNPTPLNKAPPIPMSSATSPHLYRSRSYSHSTNMAHGEPTTLFQRVLGALGNFYNRSTNKHWRPHQRRRGARKQWSVKGAVSVRNLVRAMWVLLVWWGERRVFDTAIQECLWDNWEEWVWLPSSSSSSIAPHNPPLCPKC